VAVAVAAVAGNRPADNDLQAGRPEYEVLSCVRYDTRERRPSSVDNENCSGSMAPYGCLNGVVEPTTKLTKL
jgi:hypothetical protein